MFVQIAFALIQAQNANRTLIGPYFNSAFEVEFDFANGPSARCKFDPSKVILKVNSDNKRARPTVHFIQPSSQEMRDFVRWQASFDFNPGTKQPAWFRITCDVSKAFHELPGSKTQYSAIPVSKRLYFGAPEVAHHLVELRKRWVGKKVWINGGACYGKDLDESIQWNFLKPATITSIDVNNREWSEVTDRAMWPSDQMRADPVTTCGSYRLGIAIPDDVWRTNNTYGADGIGYLLNSSSPSAVERDRHGFLIFADGWMLKELVSEVSPLTAVRGQPAAVRKAFLSQKLCKKMPKHLVMRIVGPPSFEEPLSQIMRDDVWSIRDSTPFSFDMTFDHRGRLVKAEAQGQLP